MSSIDSGTGKNAEDDRTARYDRQVRLWGCDTQRMLGAATVGVTAVDDVIVECIKNLILSGVGRVCMGKVLVSRANQNFFSDGLEPISGIRTEAEMRTALITNLGALNPNVKIEAWHIENNTEENKVDIVLHPWALNPYAPLCCGSVATYIVHAQGALGGLWTYHPKDALTKQSEEESQSIMYPISASMKTSVIQDLPRLGQEFTWVLSTLQEFIKGTELYATGTLDSHTPLCIVEDPVLRCARIWRTAQQSQVPEGSTSYPALTVEGEHRISFLAECLVCDEIAVELSSVLGGFATQEVIKRLSIIDGQIQTSSGIPNDMVFADVTEKFEVAVIPCEGKT